MPSKKKKYNARFPAGRIKKIMQTDEEVGKVAQAVPVIISRTLELFVESLLTKTLRITNARNAKTLSPSHMKQCIISESRFDFLRDLVKNIPDIGVNEEQLSGSEAGYGNEAAASPASTSTSSSSNGGGGTATLLGEASSSGPSVHVLQRSESYTPVGSNYAGALPTPAQHPPPSAAQHPLQPLPQQQHPQQLQQSQTNSLKRTLNHINSLNFYKEISLEESSSSSSANFSREPPPKLTRLHSAPAATVTTSNPVPFKIDILPNMPKASSSSLNSTQPQQQPMKVSGSAAPNSNNYKITYKIDPVAAGGMPTAARAPPTPTRIDPPVIKLDYSNLKLPMTIAAEPAKPQLKQLPHVRQQQLQPTIKIDLSNITNFSSRQSPQSPALTGSSISVKQVPSTPTASTPSTPLSALSSASSTASSASSSKSPYIFQHSAAAPMPFAVSSCLSSAAATSSSSAAASSSTSALSAPSSSGSAVPLYSSVSSTIPGMDEDYDDI